MTTKDDKFINRMLILVGVLSILFSIPVFLKDLGYGAMMAIAGVLSLIWGYKETKKE